MISRTWTALGVMAVVAAATIGVLTSNSTDAQGEGTPNRVINLSPPGGGGHAGGHVFIFEFPQGTFSGFLEYRVHGLNRQHGSMAYGLYATTPSVNAGEPVRVQTFNPNLSASFAGESSLEGAAWLTDDVTMEVFIEEDDGADAPDVGGVLVLIGEEAGD